MAGFVMYVKLIYMSYIIVGLGNPGEEYEATRHNAGRMVVEAWAKKYQAEEDLSDWKFDKLLNAQKSSGEVFPELLSGKKNKKGEKVLALLPETFMNNSGKALRDKIKGPKMAEKLVVVHDDLDLPLGSMKIVFNRGSGGHKGLESIIKALKTQAFVRVRLGVCPTTPTGKLKKPVGEKLIDFIVGEFKPDELKVFKKVTKQAVEALDLIVGEGREKAMGEVNSR
ncbi:MAG: Peptidyl-tRNA hydrolase [Parcubacteria group bacterium GW2011_GWB1_42_9]|nr:MAG: Peptidyl-tRNA hydrolase [Parcubacteria group bacterium GW2011_GWB1_42_9]